MTPYQYNPQEAAEEPPLVREATEYSTFRVKVLDDRTGHPIAGVRLVVDLPDGQRKNGSTGADGILEYSRIPEGNCRVTSDLRGARLPKTWNFKGTGEETAGTAADHTGHSRSDVAGPFSIATIEERKVKTGDSLAGIAAESSIPWQDLANFNWGTANPREINEHLFDDVGCTVRTEDEQNFILDDSDHPGLIYVPKAWELGMLATGRLHTVRVEPVAPFIVLLENDAGLRIPEAEFEAVLADESKVTDRLGKNGLALIRNPPPGEIEIEFTDLDDVEAKSLAACVRKSFDDRDPQEVYRLLHHSPEMIKAAVEHYGAYYDDLKGEGLVEDICQEITDPDALDAVLGLLVHAEVLTEEDAGQHRGGS